MIVTFAKLIPQIAKNTNAIKTSEDKLVMVLRKSF